MTHHHLPRTAPLLSRRRRGITLLIALVVIGIVSISIISMLGFSTHQSNMTRLRIERERVYYASEAGVDQVVHWFNYPSEFTDDTSLFLKDPHSESYYSSFDGNPPYTDNVFESRIPSGGLELIGEGNNEDLIAFACDPSGSDLSARVSNLVLTLPEAGDPPQSILVVNSRAANERGVSRTVRAILRASPPFPMEIPAAIISHAMATSNGHFNVHWGEAWSKGDMTLPNTGTNNIPTTLEDPWAVFRSVGYLFMANGKYADGGNGSNEPLEPEEPNYFQPWLISDPLHSNIYQHTDPDALEWPTLDYEQWKLWALDRGHYFSTDASGNLYYGTEETPENRINSNDYHSIIDQTADLFVNPGVPGSQILPEPTIIFIDTVDGLPPNNPANPSLSTNLCDIHLAGGGGIFTRGVLFVAGNFEVGGQGTPPAVWIQDPDEVANPGAGSQHLENIRHMGVIYAEGVYAQQGNQVTYGSIVARGGFGSGGTPDVWYDARLRDGMPFSFNSEVSVAHWEEVPIEAFDD
jgi:hypothetical protein